MISVIATSTLVKTFGQTRALDGLDLSVVAGEVHGFLGPNGAGKTTTIRVLLGLLRADSGDVPACSAATRGTTPSSLHRRLAYVPGDVNLWPNLTGGEAIDLFGALRGGLDQKRRAELLERFDLDPTKKCRTYSKGNRQKVRRRRGFRVRRRAVPARRADIRARPIDGGRFPGLSSGGRRQAGKTISSPATSSARSRRSADRMTIIRPGRDRRIRHPGRAAPPDPHFDLGRDWPARHRPVRVFAGVHDLTADSDQARFDVDTVQVGDVLTHLTQFDIRTLTSTPPTLEELFLRHYGDELARESNTAEASSRMTSFTGTGRLLRLALRRDRIQLPLWLIGLMLVQAVTISSIVGLYPAETATGSRWRSRRPEPRVAHVQRPGLGGEHGRDGCHPRLPDGGRPAPH